MTVSLSTSVAGPNGADPVCTLAPDNGGSPAEPGVGISDVARKPDDLLVIGPACRLHEAPLLQPSADVAPMAKKLAWTVRITRYPLEHRLLRPYETPWPWQVLVLDRAEHRAGNASVAQLSIGYGNAWHT
ncbi:hypothetical protein Asp14428_33340 [Actinoplanes sp. NBRC 14428]|nr:hypothetical protein Asp14428_33340 [Actinoplanes sp. NBRC 14428]